MDLYNQFVEYYEKAWDRGRDDQIANVEAIYNRNGLDESSGDMYECFNLLPYEAQLQVINCLIPDLELGDIGYAQEMYKYALTLGNELGYGEEPKYPYYAGIVNFYEALKAEGIDVGF